MRREGADMSDSAPLPPLPPCEKAFWQYGKETRYYTAEQMRAYAADAVAAHIAQQAAQATP